MKKDLDERLADWVDGRLAPRDLERLEAEFRVNASLRRAAEDYRQSVEHLRRALAQPEPSVDLADRVIEKIRGRRFRPRLASMLPLVASVTAAAAMVLLFLALYRIEPAGDGTARKSAKAEPEATPEVAVDRLDKAAEMADLDDRSRDLRTDELSEVAGERAGGQLGADREVPGAVSPPLAVWVQTVIGDSEVRSGEEQARAQSREEERLRLAQGLPSGEEDRALMEPTTPVVLIDLPSGQDLGARPAQELQGGFAGAGRGGRGRRAAAPPAENKDEASGASLLEQQVLQETLDLALSPLSNSTPPQVDELDGDGLVTLGGIVTEQAAPASGAPERYFSLLRNLQAEPPNGRGFLVQGERNQVARFLRQMAEWGRSQGGQVGITQVAESVVQEAQQAQQARLQLLRQTPETDDPGRRQRNEQLREELRRSVAAPGAEAGAAARPSAPSPEEISVLLLFRSVR